MPRIPTLRTERLVLRAWRAADRGPFAAMEADAEVARWTGDGAPVPPARSTERGDAIAAHWAAHGFGLWVVAERAGGAFVGVAGLVVPWFLPAVSPAAEVAWRLARPAWGRGYATEAGAAVLDHAFATLQLAEVIAAIDPDNVRSLRVAAKLGLRLTGTRRHPGAGREVGIHRTGRPPQAAGNFAGN